MQGECAVRGNNVTPNAFFSINEVSSDENSASVVNNRLKNSIKMYPSLNSGNSSLSYSVLNWVYQQKTKQSPDIQVAMKASVAWPVRRSFAINIDRAE